MANAKRLLIVEDDPAMRAMLHDILETEGYKVTSFGDAPEALEHMRRHGLPHLIIVDLGLPSYNGFELSRRIKQMGDVPIVILTGDSSPESKVLGIEQYAEDYITKPFNHREVLARVARILSRFADQSYAHEPLVTIDNHLAIDFANSALLRDNQRVALTPTEANLLYLLVGNRGKVVSSELLMARAWHNEEVYEETLRVHMHRLRRKLQPDSKGFQYIRNERGVGYRFITEEEVARH
ncbi:MAG: DNA-binding response regulator [Candidatus Thermofonsia Clade 1 bacterium]|jgi:DNA-binding response OmpR family regulator|uniref:DNA-binding response regulator n=1 Tax=Candidatus Thermofonsia Clade 1 bacterium TaxID=2364210 RepID=A0A2M8PI59_9CHLR|nr:MAG: DNA-binding response regulator [Candidatus Thermofonsia Clade 1 bacterium]RMF49959.1 MAG: DNA-binding response regulator [Chloroflexota bacterium]